MEFGVTGTALNWPQSYWTDRRHYVKLGHHCSDTVSCSSGVSQGSILGLLLFAAYVSPADDLTLSVDEGIINDRRSPEALAMFARC